MNVLVVDDDPGIARVVVRILRTYGWTCQIAADGPTALAAVERVPFGLVLLDLEMPGMCGRKVLEQLNVQRPELAVMLLSGADPRDVADLLQGSAPRHYLQKPFLFDEFRAALKHLGLTG